MDVELTTITKVLESSGLYGLVAILVVGLWRVYRDLKTVNYQVVRLTEQQTAVMVRVEGALMALRDAIMCLSGRAPASRKSAASDNDERG